MNGSTHEFAVRVVCGIRLLVDILPLSVFPGVGDQPLVYSVWAFYSFQLFCRCVVVCSVRRGWRRLWLAVYTYLMTYFRYK